MNKFNSLALVTLLCATAISCKKVESPPPAGDSAAPSHDKRDQYALLTDIRTAEKLDPWEAGDTYDAIRQDWQGKRYRWQVRVIPSMCRIGQCNVLPFERSSRDRKVRQGWMPSLDVDENDVIAINRACDGKKSCMVRFEGTLSQLTLSTEQLTRLRFSNVEIL